MMNDFQISGEVMRYSRIGLSLILTINLWACANNGAMKKQDAGAIVGGVAGAIVGNLLGGGDKATKTMVGTAIGVVLGNWIGSYLDEKDSRALERKTRETLNTASVGETAVWRSDHSGASAEITPISESRKKKRVKIKISPVSGKRKTISALNVREGPHKDYRRILTLAKGELVTIFGKTDNGWFRVGGNGYPEGFVSGKYLTKFMGTQGRAASENPPNNHSVNLRKERHQDKRGYSEEASAIVAVRCRIVRVKTKINGEISVKQVETCQDPSGSWGA